MAKILGNLRVRGDLQVDGVGGAFRRFEVYDNSTDGDLSVSAGDEDQFLPMTGLVFGTDGNEPNGQNYYIVRGTFPFEQNGADGSTTFTFRVGQNNGEIGDDIVYTIIINKDSDRPEAIASFIFLVQPDPGDKLGTSVTCTSGGASISVVAGGTAANIFCSLSIERII